MGASLIACGLTPTFGDQMSRQVSPPRIESVGRLIQTGGTHLLGSHHRRKTDVHPGSSPGQAFCRMRSIDPSDEIYLCLRRPAWPNSADA